MLLKFSAILSALAFSISFTANACVQASGSVGLYPRAPSCCLGLEFRPSPAGVSGILGTCVLDHQGSSANNFTLYNPRANSTVESQQLELAELFTRLFSVGPTQMVNEAVAPPTDCLINDADIVRSEKIPENSNYPFGSPLEGALKVHAAKYGTCNILDNIGGTEGFVGKSPEILTVLKGQDPNSCNSPIKTKQACRVLYSDCGEKSFLQYAQGWRETKMTDNVLMVKESASDCSSFVSTALMASGLKMSINDGPNDFIKTTASISDGIKNGQSCFATPSISNLNETILPGDVLNDSGNGHVVMIDHVGADPLGVLKILEEVKNGLPTNAALAKCSKLNLEMMDIGIIHSSTSATGSGIIRERGTKIASSAARKILEGHARGVCQSFVKSYPSNANYDSNNKEAICSTCTVLRHKGKQDSRCVMKEKPKVQEEECINECLQNYI